MFYGVDIMPTDNFSWELTSNRSKVNAYIRNMEAEKAIIKHLDRDIILCSWAPYGDPVLERIYDLSKQYKKTFIFIGEINGGCSGQEEFWEREDLKIKNIEKNHILYQLLKHLNRLFIRCVVNELNKIKIDNDLRKGAVYYENC